MKWEVVKYRDGMYIRNESGHLVADVDEGAAAGIIAAAPEMMAVLAGGAEQVSMAWILDWVADRMVNVYGESENVDFVQSIRKRAALCRAALKLAGGES